MLFMSLMVTLQNSPVFMLFLILLVQGTYLLIHIIFLIKYKKIYDSWLTVGDSLIFELFLTFFFVCCFKLEKFNAFIEDDFKYSKFQIQLMDWMLISMVVALFSELVKTSLEVVIHLLKKVKKSNIMKDKKGKKMTGITLRRGTCKMKSSKSSKIPSMKFQKSKIKFLDDGVSMENQKVAKKQKNPEVMQKGKNRSNFKNSLGKEMDSRRAKINFKRISKLASQKLRKRKGKKKKF